MLHGSRPGNVSACSRPGRSVRRPHTTSRPPCCHVTVARPLHRPGMALAAWPVSLCSATHFRQVHTPTSALQVVRAIHGPRLHPAADPGIEMANAPCDEHGQAHPGDHQAGPGAQRPGALAQDVFHGYELRQSGKRAALQGVWPFAPDRTGSEVVTHAEADITRLAVVGKSSRTQCRVVFLVEQIADIQCQREMLVELVARH
jgi:hypothetical protein